MTKLAGRTAFALGAMIVTFHPAVAQDRDDKLQITAFAVNMSNIATGTSATVDFNIDSWSTVKERQQLITTMLTKGSHQLLSELQDMPSRGRVSFPSWQGPDPMNARLGWDIRYAWQTPLPEGGRRIVLALDRYITFWEARNKPRSTSYPFTLIEMRIKPNGEGEGKMSIATKIKFDKDDNVIELETYASEPVRLQNVRMKSR